MTGSRAWLLARAKAFAVLATGFHDHDEAYVAFYTARAELAAWHATRAS